MPNPFDSLTALPEGLEAADADVYIEANPNLGGRWLVWTDAGKVLWERPDGKYQPSIFKPDAFEGRLWTKAE